MDNELNKVKKHYDKGHLFFDGKYFTSKYLSKDEFSILFPSDKYPTSDFTNEVGTVDISEVDFIFSSYHDLITHIELQEIEKIDNFSNEVILLGKGIVDIGEFPTHYKKWMRIFDQVADHQYPVNNSYFGRTYIFIEKSESNNSKLLSVDIDTISEGEIERIINSISNPNLLLESCLQKDAHQGEKRSTLKTSILKTVENKKIPLIGLLCFGEELLNIFHKNYETYLRSFSFEDFIKDLEVDVGEFINKVEEQIQGFYVQALAVPGAVILASALRGADKSISLALIFSTALALAIVFKSLKSKTKFINRITNNTLTKLKIYQRRTTDIQNTFAKETILEKIEISLKSVKETSEDSIQEIEKLKDCIIAIIFLYIIIAVVFAKM